MEQTIFCKNLVKAEEKAFVDYVSKKLDKIENLLQKFSQDAQLLKISVEKFDKHNAYEAEFCLNLPMRSIIAKEASHQLSKAVDLSLDRLMSQLKKHLALLRRERAHKSIRTDHTKKLEFSPLLEETI